MKNSKTKKVILGIASVTLVAVLSLIASSSIASQKAIGWKRYDSKTESCVSGRSSCIIP